MYHVCWDKEAIEVIKKRLEQGISIRDIAKELGSTHQNIHRIIKDNGLQDKIKRNVDDRLVYELKLKGLSNKEIVDYIDKLGIYKHYSERSIYNKYYREKVKIKNKK